jgi:hypothetical protein
MSSSNLNSAIKRGQAFPGIHLPSAKPEYREFNKVKKPFRIPEIYL